MTDTTDQVSDTVEAAAIVDLLPPEDTASVDATPPPPEPAPAPLPPTASQNPVRAKARSSLVPMVLGGVIAAGLGFGLAQVVPQGWPFAPLSDLPAQIAAQNDTIAALKSRLDEVANAPTPLPDPALTDRLTAVETALAALPPPADLAPLMARLDAIEQRPAVTTGGVSTVDPAQLTQLQADVAALKSGGTALDAKMAEAEARLDSVKTEAQALGQDSAARAGLYQLQAALDSGAPYTAALTNLATADLPDILTAHAASGLPSVQTLRASFPAAARAALDAATRASAGDSWTQRLSTFLRGQTGARSLTPRAGTDPDAILSRAEAAVAAGDVTTALTELDALPQAGKDAMADWLALAQQRQDGVAAVQALSASLGK